MAFVQIMEITTSRIDEFERLAERWRQATEGRRTLRREIVARDRANPNRYLMLAFFDSYESAMENSALPETQELSTHFSDFVDAPVGFTDLDIVSDRTD